MSKTLVIDRARWSTADTLPDVNDNRLYLKNSGKMCCLGFYGRQVCKLRVMDIVGKGMPYEASKWPKGEVCRDEDGHQTDFAEKAAWLNDNISMSAREREAKIKEHFKTIGIKVTFTGKYPK